MPSTLPNGGLGLFATTDLEAGSVVTTYSGYIDLTCNKPGQSVDHAFDQSHVLALGFGHSNAVAVGLRYPLPNHGTASFINSSRYGANAKFLIKNSRNGLRPSAQVVVKHNISRGEEILIDYPVI